MAESTIGCYKTELIEIDGPWRTRDHVEAATADWVHWFNTERTHGSLCDLTPMQAETLYHQHNDSPSRAA